MMTVIVDLALATLCIIGPMDEKCYPVLIGSDTPAGNFQLQQRIVHAQGYGGDVLQFKEEELEIYAIHRVWLGRPWEKRDKRLKDPNPEQRKVTKGCINVDPAVYAELMTCCATSTLVIK